MKPIFIPTFHLHKSGLESRSKPLKRSASSLIVHLATTAAAAVLLSAITACSKKEEAAVAPPEVEVVAIEQKDVPLHREWVGTLEGEVNATIGAQVSGYLLERNYNEGMIVTNGQILFQIDKAPFEAALAKARGQLGEAQARKGKTELDVKRYTPLAATEAISRQELDDAIQADKAAAAQVESAQAAVQQAELNLGFTTIRSPVDGVAGLAQAQIGNLVGPGSTLTTVTKVEPMRVYFALPQQVMTELQERAVAEGRKPRSLENNDGPELELILATGSVYPLKGKVRFADNQVDVKTGTIRVVGEFPNPNRLLVPGMFTRVRARLGTQQNALLVPQRAVTDMQGRSLIAVVGDDNKINIRPVVAGERIGSKWVIAGKIKAGERVVAEGIQKVRDGALVNPVPLRSEEAPIAPIQAGNPT